MALTYRYDADLRTVFAEASGTVSDEALLDFGRRLAADPDIPPGHKELIDLRELDSQGLSVSALRHLAMIFRAHDKMPEESRVAIVTGTDAGFGMSRLYQSLRDESKLALQVFRTLEDARAWLGLPDD